METVFEYDWQDRDDKAVYEIFWQALACLNLSHVLYTNLKIKLR